MYKSLIFPGQGSQRVGMGKDLYENFIVAKEVFENIYKNNRWGASPDHQFYSGAGTHSTKIVDEYISAIKNYFQDIL